MSTPLPGINHPPYKNIKNMHRKNAYGLFSLLLGFSILLASCGESTDQKTTQPPVQTTLDSAEVARMKELEKIFFSIPSPMEMSSLIKEKGYQFDQNKLVATSNVDKYTGESRQAVMLGVYGADLSYTAIFDQKQMTMEYFAAAQKLARSMGVDGALTNDLIERLDKHQENRDSMLHIVSEAYSDLNGYLKENQRIEVSAMIVAGGWLEGLYLSTIYGNDGNTDLRQRIAEQKYALNNLMSYLDKFGDAPALKELRADLKTIQDAYAGVGENKGKTTSSKDESGTMVIGTTTTLSMDDATLATIATLAKDLRTKYTAL
ncbi:MAG: hypothetical protein ACK478_04620 [Flavobacteriales bacterium]